MRTDWAKLILSQAQCGPPVEYGAADKFPLSAGRCRGPNRPDVRTMRTSCPTAPPTPTPAWTRPRRPADLVSLREIYVGTGTTVEGYVDLLSATAKAWCGWPTRPMQPPRTEAVAVSETQRVVYAQAIADATGEAAGPVVAAVPAAVGGGEVG